ncbi:hypothetical protein F66182_5441 [Fusarium sp. NRRL 66182]|nr:hypothetical protein F66182_5441 [Fusarium sp. NRRL 66182]
MGSCILFIGLSFVLPAHALVAYQPCLTTTALPIITVTGGQDGYQREYTRAYKEFFSGGLRTKTYTITQACSDIDCEVPLIETAPPPGFTQAVVRCSDCGSQGTQVATLTFPMESIGAYSSSGYAVTPLDSAKATQAWVDQVQEQSDQTSSQNDNQDGDYSQNNTPPAVSSSAVNSDHTSLDSPDKLESGSEVPVAQKNQQYQHDEEDPGSQRAKSNHKESTGGSGPSEKPDVDHLGDTSSQNGGHLAEPASESASLPESDNSASEDQRAPLSSSIPTKSAGSSEHALDGTGHSNDSSATSLEYNTPSDAASASSGGEPTTTGSVERLATSSSDGTAKASDDVISSQSHDLPGSSDNDLSPQNNMPPIDKPVSKYTDDDSNSDAPVSNTGDNNNSDAPDVPLIVSGVGYVKVNIFESYKAIFYMYF